MKKSKTKRFLRVAAIFYIAILVLATVGTLGWFIFDGNANIVAESGVKITAGSNLEISRWTKDGWTAYGSEIHINKDEMNSACPDITGGLVDGELKFFYPTMLDDSDHVLTDPDMLQLLDGSEGYYMEMRIKFRTSVDMGIYLLGGEGNTVIMPVDTTKTDSTFGHMTSTDYIAGAVRVSFSEVISVNTDGSIASETFKNIWVPNENIKLEYKDFQEQIDDKLQTVNKATVTESGERELFYRDSNHPLYGSTLPFGYIGVSNGQIKEYAWSHADYYNKLVSVGEHALAVKTPATAMPTIGDACELITFDGTGGKLTEKEMVIRIWFEGTDREADEALNGGDVSYQFSFIGINKDAPTQETLTKLESISYNADGTLNVGDRAANETDYIAFSYNGIDWTYYNATGTNKPLADPEGTTVYVKILETVKNKETPVRAIEIGNAQG